MSRLAPTILLSLLAAACSSTTTERLDLPPLETVPKVELSRYAGTWYEIASFPQDFQKDCTATSATYTLRDNGEVGVVNRCRKHSPQGEEKVEEGTARVVDKVTNSKLEVSFFGPFWGEYWVIQLDPDYQWAVVGHPSRDYLWILSRERTLPEATYDAILKRLEAQSYQTQRLVRTVQPS